MSKFTPDVDVEFMGDVLKFIAFNLHDVSRAKFVIDKTFCMNNKIVNVMLENQENCRFFNITKPDGSNDWWWAYSYNLMFQAIDFDWDSDVWLCKVIGYLE